MSAEAMINDTIEENGSNPEAMFRSLQEKSADLSHEEKRRVDEYVAGVRGAVRGTVIGKLEQGVAGQYDGSKIEIAQTTLSVRTSIEDTIAQTKEVSEHEQYHRDHHHTVPMKAGSAASGNAQVTIGGQEMTSTELIEGLTVHQTGNTFVSEDYRIYEKNLVAATAKAGLSISDIERAVNVEKDLTLIDDANTDYQMAA